jgi:dephospho-CoA kinase
MVYCIGLTGGIGSGKSSAAGLFRELGAGVVDTDQIAHELTGPGGAAIAAIRSQFGADFIAADGGLARAEMRRLVFSNGAAKKKLEALLHPLIRKQAVARITEARQPYVLVVVPLLFETGAYRELVSRVLVVDCPEEQQIARTTQRSRLTADEVRAIMASQLPRSDRLARADDVLRNDDDMDALRRQIGILHEKYLALARES